MGCREADEEPKGGETGVCQWARGKEKIGRFACIFARCCGFPRNVQKRGFPGVRRVTAAPTPLDEWSLGHAPPRQPSAPPPSRRGQSDARHGVVETLSHWMREELEHVETAREPKLVLQDRGDASHLPLTVPDTWPQSLMMCGTCTTGMVAMAAWMPPTTGMVAMAEGVAAVVPLVLVAAESVRSGVVRGGGSTSCGMWAGERHAVLSPRMGGTR